MSKANPRIITEMLDGYGYGQQISLGLSRFRYKRPDWLFIRCSTHELNHLAKGSCVGAIGHYYTEKQLEDLRLYKIPFYVSVSSRGPADYWPCVIPDDMAIGSMAAEYFLKKGHTHFAYCDLPLNQCAAMRVAGFLTRLKDQGFTDVMKLNRETLDSYKREISGNLPLALFSPTDSFAVSYINWFIHDGFRIPEDIAVLGVDNDPVYAPYSAVPLSSIELPLDKIGFAACELLESMINGGQQDYGRYLHQPIGVIERRSTGAIAVADPRVRRAQALMEDQLVDLQGMDSIAAEVNTTRRTLHRLFMQHLGVSPSLWLMRRRVEHAEKLLMETDYTVDHVASLAGFEERRRLYRAFRKFGRPLPSVLRGSQ